MRGTQVAGVSHEAGATGLTDADRDYINSDAFLQEFASWEGECHLDPH
jgi:hypothetical protein